VALRPSEPFQFTLERHYVRIIEADEHANAPLVFELLRTRREWPGNS
jgi:hypothetical protein